MNQILITQNELDMESAVVLSDRRAEHLLRVLQVRVGDRVRVGLLDGGRGIAKVQAVDSDSVTLHCNINQSALSPTGITLLMALPRPKVLRRLFASLASWGVEKVIFTNAAKVERVYFDTHWLQPAHYIPLLYEGLEQSGETRLPEVQVVRRLKPLIEDTLSLWQGDKVLLHPHADSALGMDGAPQSPVLAAIGPEGGWIDYEIEMFRAHGFTCMTLVERVLRSDVAVHAMLGILQAKMRTGVKT